MEELIKKHLEGWNGCKLASIQYFYETGKVSGSFFIALKEMMQEYHEQQVKNLNIPAVVGQSEQLLAFAQYLHNHSYVNKGFKPETLVRRFKGE